MGLTLDVSENGLLLNGAAIALPCDISELTAVLGKADKTSFGEVKRDMFDEDIDEQALAQLNAQTAQRACYTWNALGMHCHTDDGVTVNTLSLRMNDSTLMKHPDYYAKTMFSGTFTINGRPWLKQLEKGDRSEDTTELILGEYSVYATRTDCRLHLFSKAAKYSVIEISLDEDDEELDDYGGLFSSVK